MHINCSKDDLSYGVQMVSKAVSTKNTLPILSGILLTAEQHNLTLKATDLELSIECTISADVVEAGTAVIPGKFFTEMVRKLPSGNINISSNPNFRLKISYEQSEQNMNCFDPEEFPSIPEMNGPIAGTMDQTEFKSMVKQVSVAVSHDETRPVFTGVLIEIQNNEITMVATDTHRLALKKGLWNGTKFDERISFIVPGRALTEAARIFNDEGPVHITVSDNQIYFKNGDVSLISRLIDGNYPTYRQVIPGAHLCKTKVRMNTKKIFDSAERASVLAREDIRERSNIIKLKVEQHRMIIHSNSPEIGKIHEEIGVDLEGEEIEIAFNSKYFTDALKVIDTDEIFMDLTGPLSPGIIRPANGEHYIYLILPVRIG